MSSHSESLIVFRVHQRLCTIIFNSRLLLSELLRRPSAFLVDHPEIVREGFGNLFERDPFDFRDSNVLFLSVTRAVSIYIELLSTNYSSESDNSFESAETMSAQAKKTGKTKKDDVHPMITLIIRMIILH
jgi:hypothetical protein